MALNVKKTKVIVEEMAKLNKQEVAFLFELIKNSMVPGKHIHIAMDIVNKLKNQYKLWDKKDLVVTKEEKAKKVLDDQIRQAQMETVKRVKQTDGEIWIKEEED
jgi:DNA-nicking Smr family endonuclease|tara:strand:- start:52 stop:363 length:312 start_codon:yes stop_codon:yes gene_type:complete